MFLSTLALAFQAVGQTVEDDLAAELEHLLLAGLIRYRTSWARIRRAEPE